MAEIASICASSALETPSEGVHRWGGRHYKQHLIHVYRFLLAQTGGERIALTRTRRRGSIFTYQGEILYVITIGRCFHGVQSLRLPGVRHDRGASHL